MGADGPAEVVGARGEIRRKAGDYFAPVSAAAAATEAESKTIKPLLLDIRIGSVARNEVGIARCAIVELCPKLAEVGNGNGGHGRSGGGPDDYSVGPASEPEARGTLSAALVSRSG